MKSGEGGKGQFDFGRAERMFSGGTMKAYVMYEPRMGDNRILLFQMMEELGLDPVVWGQAHWELGDLEPMLEQHHAGIVVAHPGCPIQLIAACLSKGLCVYCPRVSGVRLKGLKQAFLVGGQVEFTLVAGEDA